MESVQLVLIVHVMILAPDVPEGSVTHVTLVDCLGVSTAQMIAKRLRLGETLLADVTPVRNTLIQVSVIVCIAVKFQMLLQFETFVESLTTDLTHRADLSGVFPHVVQQIFFLAKHVAAGIALMLHPPGVNRDVFLQTVQA